MQNHANMAKPVEVSRVKELKIENFPSYEGLKI
jgi:hypothetical protein